MPTPGDIMAGRAFVLLYAHDTPLYRGLRMAERRVQQFAYNANRIGRSMLTMAAATAAPIALSVRTFASFQDVMKEVQAVTGATGQEFDKLYEKAKHLGATTSFTASQVGEGMANLGRQGFKPEEIDAAIPSVLNLARATKTELGVAATIAAGTLRALGMEAKEMPRVADVLTATANNSAQTLEELGDTMKYAAPIADEMGLSIEQTAKAIGVLANMQIKGTMAGTSLRKIMGDLANTQTQEKLREVHVEALNADGSLRPLGDTMIDIGQAMAKMTNAQRISFAQDLFGDRAYGAALKLSKGGFDDLAAAIDNAGGSAQRTSELMDSGIGGTIRKMMSAVEGVQIALGEVLSSTMDDVGGKITEFLGELRIWIGRNRELITSLVKGVAAVGAFGASAVVIGTVANGIASTLNVMSMAVAAVTTTLKALTSATTLLALNPMTALLGVLAAVGVAMVAHRQHTAELSDEMQELIDRNDAVRRSEQERMDQLAGLADKEKLSAGEMETAGSIIAELTAKYGELGVRVNEATGAIEGFGDAQKKVNQEQQYQAEADLRAAIEEKNANIAEMKEEMQSDAAWAAPWEWSWGWTKNLDPPENEENGLGAAEKRQQEQRSAAIDIAERERDALMARYTALRQGNMDALVGGFSEEEAKADRERFDRVETLADKDDLSSAEIAEAGDLVKQLQERYGDLGIRIDETTGAIYGMSEAQRQFNAAVDSRREGAAAFEKSQQAIQAAETAADRERFARVEVLANRQAQGEGLTEDETAEAARLVEQLKEKYGDLGLRVVDSARSIIGAKGARQRFDSILEKQQEAALMDDIGKTLGVKDTPKSRKEISEDLAAGEITSDEARKLNQEMQDRIAEYRLQRIENDEQREIASINHRYDMEKRKAQETNKSLSAAEQEKHLANIELARKEAIATADAKAAKRKEEEDRRKREMAETASRQMETEIARIEIEQKIQADISNVKEEGGPDASLRIRELELKRDQQLLELQRQQALRDAKKQGIDKQLVNELYDAKVAMAEQQARQERRVEIARGRQELRQAALAPSVRVGSLEAYQTLARHNDPALQIQQNQLRHLADIEHNTDRTAKAAEDWGIEEVDIDD